jgi:hypothetical protein
MTTKHTAKQAMVAFIAMLLLPTPSQAQQGPNDSFGTDFMLPACQSVMRNSGLYPAGLCLGLVRGMLFSAPDICPPQRSNLNQAVAVVIRYVEQRPGRWHESFMRLAYDGLLEAFPCRR